MFLSILTGVILLPQAADAAKKEDTAKPNRYAPSQKRLRQDRMRAPETKVELTADGKALADKYARMLSELQADIRKQLPQIDPGEAASNSGRFGRAKVGVGGLRE